MSAPDKDPEPNLADRLKAVREIEQRIQGGGQSETDLTGWQKTGMVLAGGAVFLFWAVWTGTWPIPRGKENHENAAAFLKQQFPERELRPNSEVSSTPAVAAVFYVIRHGRPDEAIKAIKFAAEQQFGYASPYVIERLESDDPRLRRAARDYLRTISGKDYGPDAAAWNNWWRDPPRSLFGIATVGQYTVQMGIPIASGLVGILACLVGTRRRRDTLSALGTVLMVLGWFLFIGTAGIQFVGSFDTCRFGGTEIIYHQSHGVVEGLEDAKVGGAGLWLLLCLAFVAVPFLLMIVFAVLYSGWMSAKEPKPPLTTD